MNIKGQGHYSTKVTSFSNLNFVVSKTIGLSETKYHVKASGSSKENKHTTGLGHMIKMAATPI